MASNRRVFGVSPFRRHGSQISLSIGYPFVIPGVLKSIEPVFGTAKLVFDCTLYGVTENPNPLLLLLIGSRITDAILISLGCISFEGFSYIPIRAIEVRVY
ncbi:MAG: hypothetical protein IPI77_17210 [Saprospiraceae bacterium]|nr:hypothetical protein [Saprospiraceae bacterium]